MIVSWCGSVIVDLSGQGRLHSLSIADGLQSRPVGLEFIHFSGLAGFFMRRIAQAERSAALRRPRAELTRCVAEAAAVHCESKGTEC